LPIPVEAGCSSFLFRRQCTTLSTTRMIPAVRVWSLPRYPPSSSTHKCRRKALNAP
jgi:hypothetical protein